MNKKHKSLMRKWESICVICGELIYNEDSVTREHLIPQSMGGSNGVDNMGVSHFRCNQIRGDLSLREAAIILALRKKQLGDKFGEYVNEPVPHRYPVVEGLQPRNQKKAKNRKRRLQNADTGTNPEVVQSQGSQEDCGGELSLNGRGEFDLSECHYEPGC